MNCACCGSKSLVDKEWYGDGEELACDECGATNVIGIEETDRGDRAMIVFWRCAHGVHEDEPCEPCEEAA